jgi:dynein heavy chain 2
MTVVLSLDHRNRYFPQVCSANPSFFSKCRVVWLDCLKPASLVQYASQVIPVKMGNLLQPLVAIHHGSTRAFCTYLEIFKSVFAKSQAKKGNKTERLNQGLGKLKEAEDTVDDLTRGAQTKKQLLAVKQKEAD